ncbi:uncharacterized protein LOC123543116 [Mercenaria mercenaria]|uniref:uncharacterized protein LOC123543116 n=1 Tax=Mercenaria mercenaria TaxID=6596 RepID=UPI00234E6D60|nr:uncharacterized protein LOC123543116 [Mercenaria mercenaria]
MADIEGYDYLFKVLIIGEEDSGKTALLTRYVEGAFTAAYVSTIGVDFKIKSVKQDGKNIKAQIWDTAGQERFRNITSSYYRGCHGAIIVFDVTNRASFKGVDNWITDLEHYGSGSVPKVLIGNKCDLSEQRCVTYEEAKSLAVINNMEYIETSANTNINVENAFGKLYAEISKKITKQAPPMENVIRLDTESVANEAVGVAVEAESDSSYGTENIPPWANKIMEELQKFSTRLEAVDKLVNTVTSILKRLDEIEIKMSKFESRKVDFKSAQAKSTKPR